MTMPRIFARDCSKIPFETILKNAERAPAFYRDSQSDWIEAAKRELAT